MVEVEQKLTGDIEAGLDRYADKIKGSVLLSGVAAMARVVYDEVKANAHQRTVSGNPREEGRAPGTLEGAVYRVYAEDESTDNRKVYKVSVNKSKAPHWFIIEYGRVGAPAYPYIRPAFDHIGRGIKAGTDKMAQRLSEQQLEDEGLLSRRTI